MKKFEDTLKYYSKHYKYSEKLIKAKVIPVDYVAGNGRSYAEDSIYIDRRYPRRLLIQTLRLAPIAIDRSERPIGEFRLIGPLGGFVQQMAYVDKLGLIMNGPGIREAWKCRGACIRVTKPDVNNSVEKEEMLN
jgi:hypothetical protein